MAERPTHTTAETAESEVSTEERLEFNQKEQTSIDNVEKKLQSVDIDDAECSVAIDKFDYSVRTSVAKFDLKIASDKRPNVAKLKTEQCRSVQLETVAMEGNKIIAEEKQSETGQITQFTAQQLAALDLDKLEWQLSGVATRDNDGSFIASNVNLTEDSLFSIRFIPFNANNEALIAPHKRDVYYLRSDTKLKIGLLQMELGPNSKLRMDNKQTSIEISNTADNRNKWNNSRSIESFQTNAAFHCRMLNGGQFNEILVGAMSASANWNSNYIGSFGKSIAYDGCNGYLFHNGSYHNNGWPTYTTNDSIECLVNYETRVVSFFKNGTKIGTVANGIASDEPFHFGITLYDPNQCISVRQCSEEETNALLRA